MVNRLVAFTDRLLGAPARYFLPVLLLLHLAWHAPYMKLPAVGNHVWRQCNTLAVAKNYAEESMNLLEPRVDKRFDTPGITGPQFPAYDYMLAMGYKVFGFSEHLHRWLSWVLAAIGICGMYFLTLRYSRNAIYAGMAALFIAFVPELFYHSINALPDILALACMLWGWWFGLKWLQEGRWKEALMTALLLGLAGMVKMQFLVAGIPLAWGFLRLKKRQPVWLAQAVVLALVSVGSTLWWYSYASMLVRQYGLHEFVHAMRYARTFDESMFILGKTLFSDLPEIFTGYAFLPLVVLGGIAAFMSRRMYAGLITYSIGCLLFYFLVQYQFWHHGYYAIIFLPAMALMAAKGYVVLHKSRTSWLVLLIWLAPAWAWARMAKSNWTPENYRVPSEFLSENSRQTMRGFSSRDVRWIVGPDRSGCVYFYYTGAKGFPWEDATDKPSLFKSFIERGAGGIVTDRPDLLKTCMPDGYSYEEIHRHGSFRWYRIAVK